VKEEAAGIKKHVAKRPLGRGSQPCFLIGCMCDDHITCVL